MKNLLRWMIKFIHFKYPLILIPVLMVSGPFLPDLVISIVSIFFLYKCFKNNEIINLTEIYFIFFLFFWIFILFNSLLYANLVSIKSSLFYIRFGVFILVLKYFCENDFNFLKNFKNVIFITLILILIDSTIQYFYGQNILGFQKGSRISSFFGEEKVLGSFVIRFTTIYLGLYFYVFGKVKLNFHSMLILIICLYLILLSNERSALGLYILYIFLISFVFFNKIRNILIFLTLIFSILSISVGFSENLKLRYFTQFLSQIKVEKTDENKKIYLFTKAHDAYFFTSINMFKEKPLIGHGTKSFRFECENYKSTDHKNDSCNTHPHNYYVQMLAENGLIGFFSLSFVFIYFIYNLYKNILKNNNKILSLILISNIVSLWPIIPHGNFFNNWISIFIFLNFSLYVYFKKNINLNE